MDQTFALKHRMLISYGITDEVFAVAVAQPGYLTPNYMYGLILLPVLGWTAGTFLGAISGNLLPAAVNAALSLAIYGMFTAIVLPAAKQERGVLWLSLIHIYYRSDKTAYEDTLSVFSEFLQMEVRLEELQQQMEQAHTEENISSFSSLQERYIAEGGLLYRGRARSLSLIHILKAQNELPVMRH